MRRVVSVLALGGVVVVGSVASPQPANGIRAVATVGQVMAAMTIPASSAIFNVGLEAPTDEEGWVSLEHHAVVLAESGNLLLIGSRARNEEEWNRWARALVDAGAEALSAAEARDADRLLAAGDLVIEVCEMCHARYWR